MACLSLIFCGLCDMPIESDDDYGMVERVEQDVPNKGKRTRVIAHARCGEDRLND